MCEGSAMVRRDGRARSRRTANNSTPRWGPALALRTRPLTSIPCALPAGLPRGPGDGLSSLNAPPCSTLERASQHKSWACTAAASVGEGVGGGSLSESIWQLVAVGD